MEQLTIAGQTFQSRLFLGTGKFASNELMQRAIEASGSELVTVALKRVETNSDHDDLIEAIRLLSRLKPPKYLPKKDSL